MRESLFMVRLRADGLLEYEDCRGRVIACPAHEIGARMQAVLLEPDLPPVGRVSSGGFTIVDTVARNVLPPHLQPHVGPITTLAMQIYDRVKAVAQTRAYAQQQRQQHQQASQQPPGPPPHDSAFRRGHRVG